MDINKLISGRNERSSSNNVSNRNTNKAVGNNGGTAATQNTDKIDTQTADKIKSALTASNSPPVNSAKVEALKLAIAGGSYKIDAQRIASKMLQLERDLPNPEEQT